MNSGVVGSGGFREKGEEELGVGGEDERSRQNFKPKKGRRLEGGGGGGGAQSYLYLNDGQRRGSKKWRDEKRREKRGRREYGISLVTDDLGTEGPVQETRGARKGGGRNWA